MKEISVVTKNLASQKPFLDFDLELDTMPITLNAEILPPIRLASKN